MAPIPLSASDIESAHEQGVEGHDRSGWQLARMVTTNNDPNDDGRHGISRDEFSTSCATPLRYRPQSSNSSRIVPRANHVVSLGMLGSAILTT